VYAVLALLAAVENVLPPVPADAAVALGAFLTHRGVTTVAGVFLVTWIANVAGAIAVYLAARRYGRRLFATPAGRRLLAPAAIAVLEREYLRFGIFGIFVARLLPGIRAVVAPFSGLVNLSFPRAVIPMALASGLWYGGLSLVGARIGAEWSRIAALIANVNRGLGLVVLLLVIAGGAWYLVRRRRHRRWPLWRALRRAVGDEPAAEDEEPAMRAAALLMLELAYTDPALRPDDRAAVEGHLRERWGLPSATGAKSQPARHPERSRLATYGRRIAERFARERRLALVERLWQVAFEEGAGRGPRDHLARRAVELLGLSAADVADVERRLAERGRGPAA
jgi:membrane protein DedA with SNARE-associated domain/uncharacterized tellurite resistance protein B-like protein